MPKSVSTSITRSKLDLLEHSIRTHLHMDVCSSAIIYFINLILKFFPTMVLCTDLPITVKFVVKTRGGCVDTWHI